jgi:hypothetical protein
MAKRKLHVDKICHLQRMQVCEWRSPRLHGLPGGAQVSGVEGRGLRLEGPGHADQVVCDHIELVEQQRVRG